MKDIILSSDPCIEKVQSVMKALRRPIVAAKLRNLTHLRAKTFTPTRWSSIAEMLQRYIVLRPSLLQLDVEKFYVTLPTKRENQKIESLCSKYADLDSITKSLQKDDITCLDVRILFGEVNREYPDTESRLSSSASIVYDRVFDNSLVKIQSSRVYELTDEKIESVKLLKTDQSNTEEVETSHSLSLAERDQPSESV